MAADVGWLVYAALSLLSIQMLLWIVVLFVVCYDEEEDYSLAVKAFVAGLLLSAALPFALLSKGFIW